MSIRPAAWRTAVVVVLGLVGVGIVVTTAMVGHCSAFGGRCPAEAPPVLDDDVLWFASAGAAIALVPAALLLPGVSGRRAPAVGAALLGAGLVGLLARVVVLG